MDRKRRRGAVPKYRLHKSSGQSVVTLSGRDFYLGPHNSQTSKNEYDRLIADWIASGRQLVDETGEAERRAEQRRQRKSKMQPSQRNRRKQNPRREPGEHYDAASYRRAVQRGIRKANAAIERENESREKPLPSIPTWSPNKLRHNAATRIRRTDGLEAAQVILGHRNAKVTQIYAERDRERAITFMLQHG